MIHDKNCILRGPCRTAGDPQTCNAKCPLYINVHGSEGTGGIVHRANIPQDYRLMTLNESPIKQIERVVRRYENEEGETEVEAEPMYGVISDYVSTFRRQFDEEVTQIKSVYLYSVSPGTGKTTTAAVIANEYLLRHYIGSRIRGLNTLDRPVFFLSMNRWHSEYYAFNRRNVPEHIAKPAAASYYEAHRIAKSVPFLVIDDIGVREGSDAFNMDLLDLVDHRVSNLLPTVYTSNVPIEDLRDMYDEKGRIFDRVRDMCIPVEFNGDSKRGIR
ncbi:DNA replication protein [Melghirimyces algeriensis]|uniref:DNA replication protein DnaC n=1 Tax=Melghirimyces algeriensis TaxID=910412 RepID=A0A521F7X8_9BACL|nr:DNA replication protein [Melghirimyces algeriensis]SMO92247.1 DNA replication protein DnaC [Melghirimyces algeriensis]